MTDLLSMNLTELKSFMKDRGEPAFRADQVFDWMHKRHAANADEMTNIPKSLKEKLFADGRVNPLTEVECLCSGSDGTKKYLFALPDGNVIESVLMEYEHGYSVCISSQVGCRMGCKFCASTIGGKRRDLAAGEMAAQVYMIGRLADVKISNIVVMGTGEPLDNYDNLIRFIELVTHEQGMNLSARSITVSTCGLVEKIDELADLKLQITLAISLHAPNDEIRRKIMPVAFSYDIASILGACDRYFEKTGRRITFEYSLISGVNDSDECAEELAGLLKGRNCHVNLIPVNPVKERSYRRATAERTGCFKKILEKKRINATIRREMGSDIDAACGQLRRRYEKRAVSQVASGGSHAEAAKKDPD
ncbi:MAG: 23S rRNA (adenine(2503)-C(2))-methyltransferase RlmN [Lachnospiraceae bacterium]|nr:23S rRNA (adenine(2503)-C(2))-methyltransferase RlmN [Lachnospiraceae bacterium]